MGRVLPRDSSLRRSERLRRASEIQELFRQANRDERASFVVLWRHGERGRRVAFAVSRRVGGAVDRNRIRRRIREAYRREQGDLRAIVDMVFIGRPGALTRPFADLIQEMRQTVEGLNRSAERGSSREGANA